VPFSPSRQGTGRGPARHVAGPPHRCTVGNRPPADEGRTSATPRPGHHNAAPGDRRLGGRAPRPSPPPFTPRPPVTPWRSSAPSSRADGSPADERS
jgi:hypothetical protein